MTPSVLNSMTWRQLFSETNSSTNRDDGPWLIWHLQSLTHRLNKTSIIQGIEYGSTELSMSVIYPASAHPVKSWYGQYHQDIETMFEGEKQICAALRWRQLLSALWWFTGRPHISHDGTVACRQTHRTTHRCMLNVEHFHAILFNIPSPCTDHGCCLLIL